MKIYFILAYLMKILYFCTEIMKRQTNTLTPQLLNTLVGQHPNLFVLENFVYMRDVRMVVTHPMLDMVRTPQYVGVGRLLYTLAGVATVRINLVSYNLQVGDVLVIPENTFFEITQISADFNAHAVTHQYLPVSFPHCTHIHLPQVDYERIGKYMDLMWDVLHKNTYSMQTIEYLLSALMNDLKHLHQEAIDNPSSRLTHAQQIMQHFMDLVAEHGATQRKVVFYAERLLLSPNHLSAVVRQESGKTVMQWLNERTILQAKVLLKHTTLSSGEIAFQLGFSETTLFSRFFRHETGITPTQYRGRR